MPLSITMHHGVAPYPRPLRRHTPRASVCDCASVRQKEGEVARVVLRASEELAGALCRSLVLPALRSPVVAGPLRMADWAGGAGAALLQKAVPRLADTDRPLRPGGELLLRLMLAPLTLCLALGRDLLQAGVDWLVSSFPDLKPAAAGDQRGAIF